jgi:hypothetical protein
LNISSGHPRLYGLKNLGQPIAQRFSNMLGPIT